MFTSWTADEVAQQLEPVGLAKYAPRFIAEEITGASLTSLTDDHCRDLGMTIGARIRMMRWIRTLAETIPGLDELPIRRPVDVEENEEDDEPVPEVDVSSDVPRSPCRFCERQFHPAVLPRHQNCCARRPGTHKRAPFRMHRRPAPAKRSSPKKVPSKGQSPVAAEKQGSPKKSTRPVAAEKQGSPKKSTRPVFDARAQRIRGTGAEWYQDGPAAPASPKKDFRKDHNVLCEMIRLSRHMAQLQNQA
jgi:hypothetical protein